MTAHDVSIVAKCSFVVYILFPSCTICERRDAEASVVEKSYFVLLPSPRRLMLRPLSTTVKIVSVLEDPSHSVFNHVTIKL